MQFHRSSTILTVIALVLAMLAAPAPVSSMANTYYATAQMTLSTPCSVTDPCSLQAAVNKAVDGDTVIVKAGTYTSSAPQVLLINKDIVIMGGWNGAAGRDMRIDPRLHPTILDGERARRVVLINGDASPTLKGLSITGGSTTEGEGGGIAILNPNNGSVVIENCLITNNQADHYGGGIFHEKGVLTVRDSSVSLNAAQFGGGGIFSAVSTTVALERSMFNENTSSSGAAVQVDRGSIYMRMNRLIRNTGNTTLGITVHPDYDVVIENNVFAEGNQTAVSISDIAGGNVSFLHNTVVDNTITGLSITENSTAVIANNIFSNNGYASIFTSNGSALALKNNLFWQNGQDHHLGDNSVQKDPLLTSDRHLQDGSPAINAGMDAAITGDIDGDKRPVGLPDIGADEFMLSLYIPTTMR